MNALTYNQTNPIWAGKLLGKSGKNMAQAGCYVTTTASILAGTYKKLSPFGAYLITPGDLCDLLNAQPDGFDLDGQLGWAALHRLFPDVFIYGRAWTTNNMNPNVAKITVDKAVRDLRRAMLLGFTPGICVDLVNPNHVPDHIVVCTSLPDDLNCLMVMDPAFGDVVKFSDRYGDPMRGIMGYRIMVGDAPEKPYLSTDKVVVDGSFMASIIEGTWKASQVYQGVGMMTYPREILDSLMSG